MKQIVVDSVPQLFHQLRQLYEPYGIACRGQPVVDRPLLPTIDRVLASESDDGVLDVDFSYRDLLRLENTAIRDFVRLALPHLAQYEIMSFATVGGVMSTMQHHGSPTRLLDWTRSPWVACYFAVATHWKQDGVVFAFDWVEARSRINKRWLSESQAFHQTGDLDDPLLFSENSPAWLLLYEPAHPSPRMTAQQGFFTVAGRLRSDHGELLQMVLGELDLLRIMIPAALKHRVLEHLEAMNLTEQALFPGIDGVGRTVRQTLRCAVPPAEDGKEVARR